MDILARLTEQMNNAIHWNGGHMTPPSELEQVLREAHDEITRLRKLVQSMVLASDDVCVRTVTGRDNGTTATQPGG